MSLLSYLLPQIVRIQIFGKNDYQIVAALFMTMERDYSQNAYQELKVMPTLTCLLAPHREDLGVVLLSARQGKMEP